MDENLDQLSWYSLAQVANGVRVVFVKPHDIFPHCIVPAGTVATVIENSLNELGELIAVLPDDREIRQALSEWDGEVWLRPYDLTINSDDPNSEWHQRSPLALVRNP